MLLWRSRDWHTWHIKQKFFFLSILIKEKSRSWTIQWTWRLAHITHFVFLPRDMTSFLFSWLFKNLMFLSQPFLLFLLLAFISFVTFCILFLPCSFRSLFCYLIHMSISPEFHAILYLLFSRLTLKKNKKKQKKKIADLREWEKELTKNECELEINKKNRTNTIKIK